MRTILFAITAALLTVGCTSIQVNGVPSVVEAIGTDPAIGDTVTIQVGSTMYWQFRLWKKTGYRIPAGYYGTIGGAPVSVTPNDFLMQATVESQPAYCTERLTVRNLLGVPIKRTCFANITADSRFETVMVPADAVWWRQPLPRPLQFELVEEIIPRPESLSRELVFLGSSANVIRLAYREYIADLARPAYFQEVTYDLTDLPMEIAFRNAQFEILSINGSSLTYRVLSPL